MTDQPPRPHSAESLRPSPHSAESLRPRPQYGQYATAAEQRARIQHPNASLSIDAGVSPETSAPAAAAPTRAPRSTDRVITIGLLAYGAISVAMSVMGLLDFPGLATASMQMIGVPGEFTNVAQGRLFGGIAAVALVVGYVVTVLGAWRRLRSHRLGWWVPLVGAAVTYIVVYALLIPPILGDPAFVEYVRSTAP